MGEVGAVNQLFQVIDEWNAHEQSPRGRNSSVVAQLALPEAGCATTSEYSVRAGGTLPTIYNDVPILHHPLYIVYYHLDVGERVAFDCDEICQIPGSDRAEFFFLA